MELENLAMASVYAGSQQKGLDDSKGTDTNNGCSKNSNFSYLPGINQINDTRKKPSTYIYLPRSRALICMPRPADSNPRTNLDEPQTQTQPTSLGLWIPGFVGYYVNGLYNPRGEHQTQTTPSRAAFFSTTIGHTSGAHRSGI